MSRLSVLVVIVAVCLCTLNYVSTHAKDVVAPDGIITITTPSIRIQIQSLAPQWGDLVEQMKKNPMYLDAKERNSDASSDVTSVDPDASLQSNDDDITISSDNSVVFRPAAAVKFHKDDIRMPAMSAAIQKWIAVKVQEMSFMLTDLHAENRVKGRNHGVTLAGHILFLNAYVDLHNISQANLPNISWLDDKLVAYDEHVAESLKYLNIWVEWAEGRLSEIELKNSRNFSRDSMWLQLVWALKRLKKEQTVSKDLNQKIQASLHKLVNYTSRTDWLKAAITGQRQPAEYIFYREGIEKLVPKSFPLSAQYSRFHYNL